MTVRKESWLTRWSRRKLAGRGRGEHAQDPKAGPADLCAEPPGQARSPTVHDAANIRANEADLDRLDAQSDYKPFLRPGVRAEVRSAALRKLWSSEPIFSYVDGLQDYAGDFTDSAAVSSEPLATAYKVGSGFAASREGFGQEDGSKVLKCEQSDVGPSEADDKPAGDEQPPRRADAPDGKQSGKV